MKTTLPPKALTRLFGALGQPSRLAILLAVGAGEACVCHLEAATGQRQAAISQHLATLRKAGLVAARREGRNVYYRLKDPAMVEFLRRAGKLARLPEDRLGLAEAGERLANCPCPHCTAAAEVPTAEILTLTAN